MARTVTSCLFVCCLMLTWSPGYAGFVYSTEHFVDVVAKPGTEVAARSAILVLYQEATCPTRNLQSRDHQLLFLMHDYGVSTRYIWHERNKTDTLDRRYLTEDSPCLSAFYFKKGESILKPTETWSGESDLLEWYWLHLQTDILVVNRYTEIIRVVQVAGAGGGPEMEWLYIDSGSEALVTSYFGHVLTIVSEESAESGYSLDAVLVADNTTEILFTGQTDANAPAILDKTDYDYRTTCAWVWSHAVRHLRNAKQPLVVPNFTHTGYEKRQIPPDLFMLIMQFYNEHKDYRMSEKNDPGDGVHDNIGTTGPQMVYLTDAIKETMKDVLRPQMEEWSKTKLKMSAIYGIREYFAGNVLKNHVDRLDTHIISAILQIDQDKGAGEDWALEVIDFNGQRHQVRLLPGEMLFYESAKLIHGRPKPFQGVRFANCFVHFAPVEDWDFVTDGIMIRSARHGVIEPLDRLQTEITSAGKILWSKDEL